MENRRIIPPEVTPSTHQGKASQQEHTPAAIAQQFYARLTKRPDIHELLKRLARE